MESIKKLFTAHVLVEPGMDESHRHVSVVVVLPLGKKVLKEVDLELDDNDIASAKKIIDQVNKSEFGKQFEILIASK